MVGGELYGGNFTTTTTSEYAVGPLTAYPTISDQRFGCQFCGKTEKIHLIMDNSAIIGMLCEECLKDFVECFKQFKMAKQIKK